MENKLLQTKETILAISEYEEGWQEGFAIVTEDQEIKLMIDNDQCCCENWGYFMTEDNLEKFIGSELISISLTDSMLKTVDVNKLKGNYDNDIIDDNKIRLYEGDAMFVNIHTSVGVLQFVAYNEHNGYYGHEAVIIAKEIKHSVYL